MSRAPGRGVRDWTRHRERSNVATLRLMSWIATTLGRRVARWVLHPISLYFLLAGGAAPRASADYLRRVLGQPPRWAQRYAHIHHFAATVLDRVYLLRDDHRALSVRITGRECLDTWVSRGEGVLLIGAHFGSFEALRAIGQAEGQGRVAMVMYEDNARMINEALHALAPEAEVHVIGLGRPQAMLELRHWLDAGGVAGLLADRRLPQQSSRSGLHRLSFLGDEAAFSEAPFRLAALLKRPVLFMAGLYHGGGDYELRFMPLADFRASPVGEAAPGSPRQVRAAQDQAVAAALERYVHQLEALCRESPYNWFNFYDFWAEPAPRDSTPSAKGS